MTSALPADAPQPSTRAERKAIERRARRKRVVAISLSAAAMSALAGLGASAIAQANVGMDHPSPVVDQQAVSGKMFADASVSAFGPAVDRDPASSSSASNPAGTSRPSDVVSAGFTTLGVQWPVDLKQVTLSDPFGMRLHPILGVLRMHYGQDYSGAAGTRIGSMASGTVVDVIPVDDGGLGVHVVIEHTIDGKTVRSVYAHLLIGSTAVKVGDQVKAGQLVGLMGSTGMSTGPHLHFEVIVDGTHVDPELFLKKYALSQEVDIFGMPGATADATQDTQREDGGYVPAESATFTPPASPVPAAPDPTTAPAPTEEPIPTIPGTEEPIPTETPADDVPGTEPPATGAPAEETLVPSPAEETSAPTETPAV